MSTFLDYLTVLAVAALLAGPALHGVLRERRIDREIQAARRSEQRRVREPGGVPPRPQASAACLRVT
ncbi:hypothetical protein [Streptomyces xanthophaeus]